MSLVALGLIFAVIGIISTIIGLGGGTFYLLSLQYFKIAPVLIPIISLICNLVVSGFGAGFRYLQGQRCSLRFLVLILSSSIPTSYISSRIQIEERTFLIVLNIMLTLILAIRTILQMRLDQIGVNLTPKGQANSENKSSPYREPVKELNLRTGIYFVLISGLIGFVSGLIGIGGGIILGPVLYIHGMSYKSIPLVTAIYIFLNSSIALLTHMRKLGDVTALNAYLYLPLISLVMVIISIKYISYRISSRQVRNLALGLVLLLSVYNVIRSIIL